MKLNGWSVETRVYAEDPFRNFMPSIGRLVRYIPPEESDNVRVDTGIEEGSEVSMYYDPMIAKVITYGDDRERAIDNMNDALERFLAKSISTNVKSTNIALGRVPA